jgi:HEAT repeat protein
VGQDDEAFAAYQQAASIYEALGDQRGLGKTLLALGQAHFEAGDIARAVGPIERALPLLRATGAWDASAAHWEHLAHTLRLSGQIHGILGQWRRGEKPDVDPIRSEVEQRLGEQPEQPIGQLLGILDRTLERFATLAPPSRQEQAPTADELAADDTRSVEELIAALQDPSQQERRRAALALRLRGDLRAVEPLIAATRDRSQWVRMAAVRALGKLRDARAIEALSARLDDRDKEVRRSAATALGALRDVRAADALTQALTDGSWRVVESAEKALRKLRTAPRTAVLVELLQHADLGRGHVAAARLGDLGDPEAIAPLLQVAESRAQPDGVRVAALQAVAKLGDRRAAEVALRLLPGLDALPEGGMSLGGPALLRSEIARIIGQVGDAGAAPALVELLGDGNPYVRLAAIQALGAVGDTSVIPALEHIQQTDPASIQVDLGGMQRVRLRSAAVEAIQHIRERHAEAL